MDFGQQNGIPNVSPAETVVLPVSIGDSVGIWIWPAGTNSSELWQHTNVKMSDTQMRMWVSKQQKDQQSSKTFIQQKG